MKYPQQTDLVVEGTQRGEGTQDIFFHSDFDTEAVTALPPALRPYERQTLTYCKRH